MSNFTPTVTEEFEFDGDTVVVTFNRLKRKHLLILSPYMKEGEDGDTILIFEEQVKFTEAAASVLPEVIVDFKGLKDADGNALSVETVIEETYFTGLIANIISKVMSVSFVKEEEGKN